MHWERADDAIAGGWMARATRLLEDIEEGAEHARLRLAAAHMLLRQGSVEPSAEIAREVVDAGRRLGDRALEGLGLVNLGHAMIALEEGGRGATPRRRGERARPDRIARPRHDRLDLLQLDLRLPEHGRLASSRRMDRGLDAVVRAQLGHRIPGPMPISSRRGAAHARGSSPTPSAMPGKRSRSCSAPPHGQGHPGPAPGGDRRARPQDRPAAECARAGRGAGARRGADRRASRGEGAGRGDTQGARARYRRAGRSTSWPPRWSGCRT